MPTREAGEPTVVRVGPGQGTTFDGARHVCPVVVTTSDGDRWTADEPRGAVSLATRVVKAVAPDLVKFDARRGLPGALPVGARDLELALQTAANEVDASLVVERRDSG